MVARRFDVWWVRLDPTVGSEIRKTRPCVVISPDELNFRLKTVLVAPLTTSGRAYDWRIPCRVGGKSSRIALDQIRTVDKARLLKRLGTLPAESRQSTLAVLVEMFAE